MAINPLFDPSTDNQVISPESQKMINQDLVSDEITPQDQAFLDHLMDLVNKGTIQLFVPDSLINQAIYAQVSDEAKGLADQNALTMLSKIRQIVNLKKTYDRPTYQMISLVASLRQNKERLEEHAGDIFIL